MKHFLSFLFCIGMASIAAAQHTENNQQAPHVIPGHIHLVGNITSGTDTVPYLVNLVVNPDGAITGYSITNWLTNNLKASLIGSRDKDGNLVIKEIPDGADNNYFSSFCYFNASLKRMVKGNSVTYEGSYISLSSTGQQGSCEGGHMTLRAGGHPSDDPQPTTPDFQSGDTRTNDNSQDWEILKDSETLNGH